MVSAWIYDHKYMDDSFDYNDTEKQYLDGQQKTGESQEQLK